MKTPVPVIEDWVASPIHSDIGTIWLGGYLSNSTFISRNKMRILGRYAVVMILNGEVFYADGRGREKVLESGDVILVTPELAHAYGTNDGQPWSQTYVVFDGPQFDLLQQSECFQAREPVWKLESINRWKDQLERILRRGSERYVHYGIRTIGNFVQLLIEMMATKGPNESPGDIWLAESMSLLEKPQETGWKTPQTVASEVGLSYENFRKLFTQKTGKPPSKFQRQRKIDLACAAIYRGSANFKELAEELEFCDVYHFSKAFRQIKGIPPSTYRRTVRGK